MLEISCNVIEMPKYIYRLFVAKYIFLLYLGCIWRRYGISNGIYPLAIISIIFVLLDFNSVLPENIFVFNLGWKGYYWVAYFYSFAFLSFLIYLYKKIPYFNNKYILKIGKCSYEIFLVQMFIFGFQQYILNPLYKYSPTAHLLDYPIIKFAILLSLSLIGGYFFNLIISNITTFLYQTKKY